MNGNFYYQHLSNTGSYFEPDYNMRNYSLIQHQISNYSLFSPVDDLTISNPERFREVSGNNRNKYSSRKRKEYEEDEFSKFSNFSRNFQGSRQAAGGNNSVPRDEKLINDQHFKQMNSEHNIPTRRQRDMHMHSRFPFYPPAADLMWKDREHVTNRKEIGERSFHARVKNEKNFEKDLRHNQEMQFYKEKTMFGNKERDLTPKKYAKEKKEKEDKKITKNGRKDDHIFGKFWKAIGTSRFSRPSPEMRSDERPDRRDFYAPR